MRSGLAPVDDMPKRCWCGADLTQDPWHGLSHSGGNSDAIRRHNQIMKALVNAVEMAGGKAWLEPRFQIHHTDDEHTDIRVALGAKLFYIDVTVVHPTAASYLHEAVGASLKIAKKAERSKSRQYKDKAKHARATFVPFVMETFGGFGKCARDFVNLLATFARSGSALWTPADVRRTAQRAVLDALMLGNMQMLTAELTKCHRTPPPRRLGGDRGASVTSRSTHNSGRRQSVYPPTRARGALQQQRRVQEAPNQTPLLSVSLGAVEAEPAVRLVRTAPGLEIAVDVELEAGSQPALTEPVAQAPPATVEDSEVVVEAEARDDVLAVIFSSQEDGDGLWRDLLGSEEP
jgi:hypothetical protein